MADRRVKVIFEAEIANFKKGMAELSKSTDEARKNAEGTGKATEKQLAAMSNIGPGIAAIGAVGVAGFGLAVNAAAGFDKALSSVRAATHASAEEMDLLRDAAVKTGADTAFSAEEAAQGIEELAKAGVSTADILGGGLDGSLALAAAGALGVGEASEIAATALTQFKLEGSDVGHIADLLAAGAGKAQGSVGDLGAALGQAGLVASSTGLTIEETTGGLAAFASAGLTGSDAGTSFKSMLQRLNPQSKEAKNLMEDLGLSAYDSQGNFIGLSEYAGELQTSLAGMSEEQRNATMTTLFGSDAVRAANVLYEQGAAGIEKWEGAVNDAGYAAETAAIMQDNLAGDLEKLGGAFDTVLIQSGSGANEAMRGLVQGLESVVDLVGKIPAPVLTVGAMIAGIGGGAALLGGGLITVIPKIRDTRDALRDLGPIGQKAERGLSKAGRGLGSLARGAGVAGGLLAVGTALATIASNEYMKNVPEGTGHIADALARVAKEGPGAASALDAAFKGVDGSGLTGRVEDLDSAIDYLFSDDPGQRFNRFGQEFIGEFAPWIKGGADIAEGAFKGIDTELGNMVSSGNVDGAKEAFDTIREKLEASGVGADEAAQLLPGYADALARASAEAENAAGGTDEMAGALETLGDSGDGAVKITEEMAERIEETGVALDGTISNMQTYLDLLFATGMATMSSRDAQVEYEQALDAVDAAVTEITEAGGEMGAVLNKNKSDFDLTSEAGQLANSTFQGLSRGGMTEVKAMADEGVGQDGLQKKLGQTYRDLIKAGEGFGMSAADARALARDVLGVPDGVTIDSWMSTVARKEAERTNAEVESLDGKTANVYVNRHNTTYNKVVDLSTPAAAKLNPTIFPGQVGFKAEGGLATGWNIVGEEGPELVNFTNPGRVYTAEETAAAFAAPAYASTAAAGATSAPRGAGISIGDIKIYGATDANRVRREVMDEITYKLGTAGVRIG